MTARLVSPGSVADAPRGAGQTCDVVYTFSRITWQAAYRRGFFMSEDRLAQSLVASERVGRLLIGNPARQAPVMLARQISGADRVPFPADERINLVEPISRHRRDPTSLAEAERAFRRYDRALARAARRHGLSRPHVITGNPMLAAFSPLTWASSVTWYAIDDWSEHPAYAPWREIYLECYERVRANGRAVAAVSQALLDRLAPSGPSLVVPNGIDPDEWTTQASPPPWMAALPRPLFAYVGTLDGRIDLEWIQSLAAAQPSATILFVGPLAEPGHLARLSELPNVRIQPPLDRAEVNGLLRAADVGLLPHVVSRLTQAMSPLKLLEYLAAGLPVASTDLEPVRRIGSPRVALADQNGDFVAAARAALSLGRATESERLAFIAANSWRSRHDQILDLALSGGSAG